ncbi:hypothetical protein ACTOJ1_000780 [Shigella flexneri]
MSLLTMAIRFSDGQLTSFKIHKTKEFNDFKNILFLLDEKKLLNFLEINKYPLNISANNEVEHNDYDSQKSFFAPYDYGIVFIDFITKKVHSYNNYSGFLEYSMSSVNYEIGSNTPSDSKYNLIDENIKKLIENFNIVDTNQRFFNISFNTYQGLKNNASVFYLNAQNPHEEQDITSDNIFDVFQKALQIYSSKISKQTDLVLNGDIFRIAVPDWNITSSDAEHINELFNEISDIIPQTQIKYWLNK